MCTVIGAYGQSSPKMKDGKKIIDKEMFVDMGIKSDNGNTLLWETNNWWPSSDWIPMYLERPKTFPAEQFIYKDAATGMEYTVTARFPSIDEWKRLVNSVTLKTPRNSEEAATWYAVYPRNTNVYTNSEGRKIFFRPGPYFSAEENAFVKVIDERDAKGNNANKLLTVLENNNDFHKAYVRRVVEVSVPKNGDMNAMEQPVSTISINGQPVKLWL